MNFGFDDGMYNLKGVGRTGPKTIEFETPSMIRKGVVTHSSSLSDAVGIKDGKTATYLLNDVAYSTGAVQNNHHLNEKTFGISDENVVLVHAALHAQGFSGKSVNLCTGLPFASYYQVVQGKPNEKLIEQKLEAFKQEVTPYDSNIKPVSIEHHMVMAQAEAAYFDAAININVKHAGKGLSLQATANKDITESTVLLFDVGGGTADFVLFGPNGVIDFDRSGTIELGGWKLIRDAEAAIKTELSLTGDYDRSAIESALRTGEFQVNKFEKIDVNEIKNLVIDKHLDALFTKMYNRVGRTSDIDALLPIGGTTLYYQGREERFTNNKHIFRVNNVVTANANGMCKKLLLNKAKK